MKVGIITMTSTVNKESNLEFFIKATLKAHITTRINKAQDEEFKACPAPYSRYKVSRKGIAKGPSGKILTQNHNNAGYCILQVTKDNNKNTGITVSRLVALTWLPNKDELSDVDHINGDLDDNCVDNLQWLSHPDNLRRRAVKGGKHAVTAVELTTGNKTEYSSISAAAVDLGISYSTIRGIANGTYSLPDAGGYYFVFAK